MRELIFKRLLAQERESFRCNWAKGVIISEVQRIKGEQFTGCESSFHQASTESVFETFVHLKVLSSACHRDKKVRFL